MSEAFGANPFDGGLYVFRSKRRDRVKILTWDGSGLVLYYKRIEGQFTWPPIKGRRHVAISCSALGPARWLGLEACADASCGSAGTSRLIIIKRRSSLMQSCCRITLHE
ncbi:IS66 family insertion sequence element accessory protein TnpB [Bradyrhizobium oropedii]|uniref:IS66 family insertion sequence element accessory protein TnpB n=1 Tax=Bradyrhizobium oropedii TaxID=1571201 RepID=UPI003B845932